MMGYAVLFLEPVQNDEEDKSNEDDEEFAEEWREEEVLQYTENANSNGSSQPGDNGNIIEGETRWVLGNSNGRTGGIITTSIAEDDRDGHGEKFQQAFARNMRAMVVTRRTGSRARKPTKFFDEMQTDSAAKAMSGVHERVITTGTGKRYASINVRTLAVNGDKHRKEA
jgi:hypothetical protein